MMSKHKNDFTPSSFAQHFNAPDEFIGYFGWMCGYSADNRFLEDAVERFTRHTPAQRANQGRISLALMLNSHNKQISPIEVPGVLHLPVKKKLPMRLLHAKVAILGFRHETDAKQWRLRLIVSTGNWTWETLEKSLDLAWILEIGSDNLGADDDAHDDLLAQNCADLDAAWDMLKWLQGYFDTRTLNATRPPRDQSTSADADNLLRKWIAKTKRDGGNASPRFFDSRRNSLLDQLSNLIKHHGGATTRNYLAMGSGFYESSSEVGQIPSVLTGIVDQLRGEQLLSRDSEIDVFVNPIACQAVAGALKAIRDADWEVRRAWQPTYFGEPERSLHAKFLFSFNYRRNSDLCNSAWLYLGSGNLTGPGFANEMSSDDGNLEAGVVLSADDLHWESAESLPQKRLVSNVLPIRQDNNDPIDEQQEVLERGEDMPDPVVNFTAPPVAAFFWEVIEGTGWLGMFEGATQKFDVLDESGQTCQRDAQHGFRWNGSRPRQVQVRWNNEDGQQHTAFVPVIDEYGRIAATIMPKLDLNEAWSQLENFPMPPADEEIRAGENGGDVQFESLSGTIENRVARYPVREMMQLIESIAAKQTAIQKADWIMWCNRLEQCLSQAADSTVLKQFLELKLNPLSPLLHAPFRPDFAVSNETTEGRRYEQSISRIAIKWQVNEFQNLGVQ